MRQQSYKTPIFEAELKLQKIEPICFSLKIYRPTAEFVLCADLPPAEFNAKVQPTCFNFPFKFSFVPQEKFLISLVLILACFQLIASVKM